MISGPGGPLHQCPGFRSVAGEALRPGGLLLTDRLLSLAALPTNARLLDLGCGPGLSARHAARHWGLRVTGVDTTHADLLQAKAKDSASTYIQADMNQPPFRLGRFDTVLCECVLTLQPEPERLLKHLATLLKPKGLLLLTDVYLRERHSSPPGRPEAGCCLDGAVPRQVMEQRLAAAGFTVTLFEDHSRLLAELTARLIFAGMDPRERFGTNGGACTAGQSSGKPGYFLLVALRNTPRGIDHRRLAP